MGLGVGFRGSRAYSKGLGLSRHRVEGSATRAIAQVICPVEFACKSHVQLIKIACVKTAPVRAGQHW